MATKVSDFVLSRLREWGVERVFAYPGDAINGLLAAWGRADNDPVFVQARHQEMVAFEAVGYAKFTGRVGVCAATSGPGAIHLLNGLYDAKLDHVPVVAIVGQTSRSAIGGLTKQEIDLLTLYKDVASQYCEMVTVPEQLPNVLDRAIRVALSQHGHVTDTGSAFSRKGKPMKTGICLFWIGVGAILTFAVTANTSVFNLHVAGFVIMVIGVIGLVTPRRGYEWLGRRVYVRRGRRGGASRVEETSYPPYVLRNPGTANAQADIPDRPSLEPDPEVARWQEPAATPDEEMATSRATSHGADRYDGLAPDPKKRVPSDTEVLEDVYEEPPA